MPSVERSFEGEIEKELVLLYISYISPTIFYKTCLNLPTPGQSRSSPIYWQPTPGWNISLSATTHNYTSCGLHFSVRSKLWRWLNILNRANMMIVSLIGTIFFTLIVAIAIAPFSLKVFRTVQTWHLGGHSIRISVEQRESCASSDDKRNLNEPHRGFCKQQGIQRSDFKVIKLYWGML